MVDLDAPGGITNTSFSPFLHWLTPVSASSSEILSGQNSTSAVAPYIGPAPPAGNGMHRYVVLLLSVPGVVFQWPSNFPAFDANNEESRVVFDVEKFAIAGRFQPVAANWFTTENKTTGNTTVVPSTGISTSTNVGFPFAILSVVALVSLALVFM